MTNPQRALGEQVREELKIAPAACQPLTEGCITGSATLIGALIPVLPFLMLPPFAAMWFSFGASMFAHFGVGAARSCFTGRGLFRSGIDMFAVGLGIAAAGYAVGALVEGWL